MIFVGVIVVIGVLLFAAFAAYSVHRRSVMVDLSKQSLQKRRSSIHKQDQLLLESFIESLLAGKPLADNVPTLLRQRATLLTEKGDASGVWTPEDVDEVLDGELRADVGRINRKIALPMALCGISILVLTTVSAASLYTFMDSRPSSNTGTTSTTDASDPFASDTYDPFAIETPTPTTVDQP